MRTTLNIDDDVLVTAQFLARKDHKSVGEVISGLARSALRGSELEISSGQEGKAENSPLDKKLAELGLVPFKAVKGAVVTNVIVAAIREAEGI